MNERMMMCCSSGTYENVFNQASQNVPSSNGEANDHRSPLGVNFSMVLVLVLVLDLFSRGGVWSEIKCVPG